MSGTASRLRRFSTPAFAHPSVWLLTAEYNVGTGWHVITCLPVGDSVATLLFLFYAPEFVPLGFLEGPKVTMTPRLEFSFPLPAPSLLGIVAQLWYGSEFLNYTNNIDASLVLPP